MVLVGNPANPYSRATRIGRTLVSLGYDVEIAATTELDAPLDEWDGELHVRRYPPSGIFGRLMGLFTRSETTAPATRPGAAKRAPSDPARSSPSARSVPRGAIPNASLAAEPSVWVRRRRKVTRFLRPRPPSIFKWMLWPHRVRGWWRTLASDLPPADLYHVCGILPLAAALAARGRDERAGRHSVVIEDVIDMSLESNNVLDMPAWVLDRLSRRERGWVRAADAHTAVNDVFADRAVDRWQLVRRPTVVPNYPEPWTPDPGAPPPDLIRTELGLPASARICLFWGRLGNNMGLDEAAEAVLLIPDAVLVLLGVGKRARIIGARDSDPRYQGRHFTLPARHPDDLAPWVASADVALVTLPPVSFNQRYTTPNKFLEAIMAGTPMVLGPDLPTMADLLEREDLGRIAASMDPRDIAAAMTAILDLPAAELAAWRERIRAAAHARYSWPIAAEGYRELIRSIDPRATQATPTADAAPSEPAGRATVTG